MALAFVDVLQLIRESLTSPQWLRMAEEEAMIVRYFDIETPRVGDVVINVFTAIYDNSFGPPLMLDPGSELEIWYQRASAPKIQGVPDHRAFPGQSGRVEDADDSTYMFVLLCPEIFWKYQLHLSAVKCSDLGDAASNRMMVPGAALLHKMLHWSRLTVPSAGIRVVGWNEDQKECVFSAKG
jgi:hypothetical protein